MPSCDRTECRAEAAISRLLCTLIGSPRLGEGQHHLQQRAPMNLPAIPDKLKGALKTAIHVGFIPGIILAGYLFTEPRPTLLQLLAPM